MSKRSPEVSEFSLRIPKQLTKDLDRYAKKMGISRNSLARNLLEIGVDDLRMLDRVGLLVVGRGLRDLVEKIKRGEIKLNGQEQLDL